jgi:hypothetical protein
VSVRGTARVLSSKTIDIERFRITIICNSTGNVLGRWNASPWALWPGDAWNMMRRDDRSTFIIEQPRSSKQAWHARPKRISNWWHDAFLSQGGGLRRQFYLKALRIENDIILVQVKSIDAMQTYKKQTDLMFTVY